MKRTTLGLLSLAVAAVVALSPVSALAAPGNNGDIHVVTTTNADGTPGCSFTVEFTNFDDEAVTSTLEFDLQSPTPGTVPNPVAVRAATFTGGHQATVSVPFDISDELLASGAAPTAGGYHVMLTTHTPFSNGNDVKHKVFWVGACEISPTFDA